VFDGPGDLIFLDHNHCQTLSWGWELEVSASMLVGQSSEALHGTLL